MNNAWTPILDNNFRTAFAVSSGPLSDGYGQAVRDRRIDRPKAAGHHQTADAERYVAELRRQLVTAGALLDYPFDREAGT